jgi:hypothetical protein
METVRLANSRSDRNRLARARERGYQDVRRASSQHLLRAYSLWCWRLLLPVVWFERRIPRSKYGRVRLDMFTTGSKLTASGQAEMTLLGVRYESTSSVVVSPHDACWDRIPLKRLESLAHDVIRAAIRAGNHESIRSKRSAKVVPIIEAHPVRISSRIGSSRHCNRKLTGVSVISVHLA